MLAHRVRSCLHVRPKQSELCFAVSDVGVDLPSIVGKGEVRDVTLITRDANHDFQL